MLQMGTVGDTSNPSEDTGPLKRATSPDMSQTSIPWSSAHREPQYLVPPAGPWTQCAHFALFRITARRAAASTGKAWGEEYHRHEGARGLTVPSPPQARIRRLWTFRYSSSLQGTRRVRRGGKRHQRCYAAAAGLPALAQPLTFTKPPACPPSPSSQQFTAVCKVTVTLASPALADEEWGVHSTCICLYTCLYIYIYIN